VAAFIDDDDAGAPGALEVHLQTLVRDDGLRAHQTDPFPPSKLPHYRQAAVCWRINSEYVTMMTGPSHLHRVLLRPERGGAFG
jgi:hypothetical protein